MIRFIRMLISMHTPRDVEKDGNLLPHVDYVTISRRGGCCGCRAGVVRGVVGMRGGGDWSE